MAILQIFSQLLPLEHPARTALMTALFIVSSVLQSSLALHLPISSEGVTLIRKTFV